MRRVILLTVLYAPMSFAVDYRQEILDYMINPCVKTTLKREGLDPDRNPQLIDFYISQYGQDLEEMIEILQVELNKYPVSSSERKQLYQIGLNSCLNQ